MKIEANEDRQKKYEEQRQMCMALANLYPVKNENYDDSFGKTFQKFGPISALTRMDDKWNRIEALIMGGADNVGESLEDTLMDLANYSLMTIVELRRYHQKIGVASAPLKFEILAKQMIESITDHN